VLSLSPLWLAELVKPAATLSFQSWVNHGFELASMKVLKGAEALPI
jgi:hypothetical protein